MRSHDCIMLACSLEQFGGTTGSSLLAHGTIVAAALLALLCNTLQTQNGRLANR